MQRDFTDDFIKLSIIIRKTYYIERAELMFNEALMSNV